MGHDHAEALYRRFGAFVLRRARVLLGEDEAAEDALQEVFVRVLCHHDGFRSEAAPVTWLYRITTNYCCQGSDWNVPFLIRDPSAPLAGGQVHDGTGMTFDSSHLWIAPITSMWGRTDGGFWFAQAGFYEYSEGQYSFPALRRYDGHVATDVFIGEVAHNDSLDFASISGATADDIWAAGSHGYPPQSVRGCPFRRTPLGLVTNTPETEGYDIVVAGPSSVWLVAKGPFFRLDRIRP
jgi:hypothetical protein